MAMEPGPAQWQTYGEATQSYERAIEFEPEHWQARYGLAFGNSMAPEFAGLRPRAIREFEELMKLQETRAPAEEHTRVYLRLGTLYKDAGNPEKARAIWQRGLKRHPESEQLHDVVSILEER
jgi:tetratricopeptide (TPR) repeat protein